MVRTHSDRGLPAVRRTVPAVASALSLALLVGACSTSSSDDTGGRTSSEAGSRSADGSSKATDNGSDAPSSDSPAPTHAPVTSADQATRCASRVVGRMTPRQRSGQLLMVGLQAGYPTTSVTDTIRDDGVGNMLFLGGWEGSQGLRAASGAVRTASTASATSGVQPFIAADQEGGAVWQVREPGVDRLPSALELGRSSAAQRVSAGTRIGQLLTKAGVNTNLAPVADTVPAEIGTRNAPIGRHQRQFGSDPRLVAEAVADTVRGLHAGGVATTLKHFPGLGRVTGNTDFTAQGTRDEQATATDPYLEPFRAGIKAGTDLVMVSSAVYPKIDGSSQALFSRKIVTDLLRSDLGFGGVVITDDVNAAALRSVPVAQRAVRFVQAGGDIVLTGRAADAPVMAKALRDKAANDPAFRAVVDAAATRVVAAKARRGLVDCG